MDNRLTDIALNRALLARQGLLDRMRLPVVEAVEAIGAVQAQHWPAVAVALWSRVEGLQAAGLHAALEARELLLGSLLRGTLHVVSAREHPWYAAVTAASAAGSWRRTDAEPPPEMDVLRAELQAYAAAKPRGVDELVAFIEAGVELLHPALAEAELVHQRQYRWRPFLASSGLVRVPTDGRWDGARPPEGREAAPASPAASTEEALEAVARMHLRAFGPASAEDVAGWIGWRTPPVREALDRMGPALARFRGEAGRVLYDLLDAPRPDADVEPPVRLLPWFDSVLLAYAPRHRARVLPDAFRDRVYVRANLQWLPTFLADGLVAGTWSVQYGRSEATLSLQPFVRLGKPARTALVDEAERLVRFLRPAAATHRVAVQALV
ncbi:MAG TPA: winged helix DNA-binding domain-containing protein [Candidatus Dormibacteraeota bacterium]|nr:winged helix DNA-binding domain-containing protein [Candidatus Dormibacteraeota bacterium]